MSLAVHDLEAAILEGKQPIAELLKKAKALASELGLAEFEAWVDLELTGYPHGKERPGYREVTTSRLLVGNIGGGWEDAGEARERFRLDQPIGEIESLAKEEQ